MSAAPIFYLNGRFVDEKNAKVPAFDRGLMYGEGVFETMRALDGAAVFLGDHYARLREGARQIGICCPIRVRELAGVIRRLCGLNSLSDAYVRITLTGGDNKPGGTLLGAVSRIRRSTLIITAKKISLPPASAYRSGVALMVSHSVRCSNSRTAKIKTTSYIENLLAKREAGAHKAFDSVFLDENRRVTECSSSNIFWVRKRTLVAPSAKLPILPGITRKAVIKLAKQAGIYVKENDSARLKDLFDAEEVFITNSIIGVLPVKKIVGKKIGSGAPGKITSLLADLYNLKIRGNLIQIKSKGPSRSLRDI